MKKDQFELRKFKITPSGTVEMSYDIVKKDKEVVYAEEIDGHKSPRIVHKDMEKALQELIPYLADSNKLRPWNDDIKIMPKLKKHMEAPEGKRLIELWDNHINESIEVSGITIGGDLEDEGWVIITGKRVGALNSPKINFNGTSYGFENKLKELVKKVIDEAFEYCFKNKSTTPEIEFPEEEAAA